MLTPYVFGALVILAFFLLSKNFLREVPPHDKLLIGIFIAAAFLIYTGLFIWVYEFFLKERFLYGDGEGYHEGAIIAIDYFSRWQFTVPQEAMDLTFIGYPAYFIAPIYILGGVEPKLPIMVQLVLCLHIGIMLYKMTALCTGNYKAAKAVLFFSLFFPEVIGLALYLLKDMLILWLIVASLYCAILIREKGFNMRYAVYILLMVIYLHTLRAGYSVLTFLVCFVTAALPKTRYMEKKIAYSVASVAVMGGIVFFLFANSPTLTSGYLTQLAEDGYFLQSVNEDASNLASVVIKYPKETIIYILKILQAMLAGGLAGIREILQGYRPEYSERAIGWIFGEIGAVWRFINLPVTMVGLWIVLRRYRKQFMPVLIFSLLLVVIMFFKGYSTRFALPAMMINSISWGIGFAALFPGRKRAKEASG